MSETNKEKGGRQPIEVIPSMEERILNEWQALERPFQRKDKDFWTTILSILGLVCLILIFVKEWFLIATLAGLAFLYYVLTTIKPEKSKYKITNKGVYISSTQRIDWELIRRFWISKKWGNRMINLDTWLKFPRVFSIVVPKKQENKITETLKKYIPQEENSPQFLDKFSNWVTSKIPLESDEEEKEQGE